MRDDATERPCAAQADMRGLLPEALRAFACRHGVSVKSCGACDAEKEAAGSPTDGPSENLMPSEVQQHGAPEHVYVGHRDESPDYHRPYCNAACFDAGYDAAQEPAPGEVAALRAALEDVTMGLAIFGVDDVPGSGEVERAVDRGRAALAASEPTLAGVPEATRVEVQRMHPKLRP